MEKSTKELKKEYQEFLENITVNLEKIRITLNIDKITFNEDEVNNSVKLYFKNFIDPKAIGLSEKELENIIDTYWGEAFKYYQGGEWALNLSKKDKAYGTPTIENWGGKDYPWSRISPKVWRTRVQKLGLEDMLPATYIYK